MYWCLCFNHGGPYELWGIILELGFIRESGMDPNCEDYCSKQPMKTSGTNTSTLSVTQRFLELKSKTTKEWGWSPSRKTSKILLVQKHTVQGFLAASNCWLIHGGRLKPDVWQGTTTMYTYMYGNGSNIKTNLWYRNWGMNIPLPYPYRWFLKLAYPKPLVCPLNKTMLDDVWSVISRNSSKLLFLKWVWINTYRYIFSGMNIRLPAILMFTRGTRFWFIPKWWSTCFFPLPFFVVGPHLTNPIQPWRRWLAPWGLQRGGWGPRYMGEGFTAIFSGAWASNMDKHGNVIQILQ